MQSVFVTLWALFLGLALLMLGMGLQGTLLGLRASLSGFGTDTTGMVMSCYYIGFIIGSRLTPQLIRSVGHVRVFGALASLVSVAPLLYVLLVNPVVWALVRMMSGIGMVGIFIVVESWLNATASNQNRGKLLSLYVMVCQIAMAGGQFLLYLGDPLGAELFILVSVLCTLPVIPLSLSNQPAPHFSTAASMPLRQLWKRVPLAVAVILLVSLTYGAFYGMGPVYALKLGLNPQQIAIFMASAILGSFFMQWPIGQLSDRIDRRRIITVLCCSVTVIAVLLALVPAQAPWLIYVLMFLYGGLSFPLYSLLVALAGDRLHAEELVAASSKILFVNGVGSAFGPLLVSTLMNGIGSFAFPIYVALLHAVSAWVVLRNLHHVPLVVVGAPAHFTAMSPQASVVATEMAGRIAGDG